MTMMQKKKKNFKKMTMKKKNLMMQKKKKNFKKMT
jgi:hypothetical protein